MTTPRLVPPATWVAAVAATAVGPRGDAEGRAGAAPAASLEEVRALAAEAYVFAYPLLRIYPLLQGHVADPESPLWAGGFHRFRHHAQDAALEGASAFPCRDTRASWAWLDLRAEPQVVTAPAAPERCYASVRVLDLHTQQVGVAGPGGGDVLVAGPGWSGAVPAGVRAVLRAETRLAAVHARTASPHDGDLRSPSPLQRALRVTPLGEFSGTRPPRPAPPLVFPPWDAARAHSREFLGYLNFMLLLCPPHPSEVELLARLARLGVGPGWPPPRGDPARGGALDDGVALGKARLEATVKATRTTADLHGSREGLGEHAPLKRALQAALDLHGSPVDEEFRAGILVDNRARPLEGARRYALRFPAEGLPRARAFWTLTAYGLPDRKEVDNALGPAVLDSRSPALRLEPDGGLVVRIQHKRPGGGNWLPAPAAGPFCLVLRAYWPAEAMLQGRWSAPVPAAV